jgi:hypothetical protein
MMAGETVKMGKVDCQMNRRLCDQLNIQAFPHTLLFTQDGTFDVSAPPAKQKN